MVNVGKETNDATIMESSGLTPIWFVAGVQKLDLSDNILGSLPDELSRLGNLKELLLRWNKLQAVPVSVLSALTALKNIDLSQQHMARLDVEICRVASPLLPILHPGLLMLDLRQPQRKPWDSGSLFHLECAMAAVADSNPLLTFRW